MSNEKEVLIAVKVPEGFTVRGVELESCDEHGTTIRMTRKLRLITAPQEAEPNSRHEELKKALAFYDQVNSASESDRAAVGGDHWDWIISAVRKVVDAATEQPASDMQLKGRRVPYNGYATITAQERYGTQSVYARPYKTALDMARENAITEQPAESRNK